MFYTSVCRECTRQMFASGTVRSILFEPVLIIVRVTTVMGPGIKRRPRMRGQGPVCPGKAVAWSDVSGSPRVTFYWSPLLAVQFVTRWQSEL
jgi:hypothetical protein